MKLITQLTLCLVIGFSLQAKAALVARDLDGNFANGHEAVYDTVLNITWMADMYLATHEQFGVSGITGNAGTNDDAIMSWQAANEWLTAMNASNGGAGYLGVNSWRLPQVTPVNGIAFDLALTFDGTTDISNNISAPVNDITNPLGLSAEFTGSELMYHYYNNFGGLSSTTGVGSTFTASFPNSILNAPDPAGNKDLFTDIFHFISYFWTGTEILNNQVFAVSFFTTQQSTGSIDSPSAVAWVVTDGDVGTAVVPLPGALPLFGMSLLLLRLKNIRRYLRLTRLAGLQKQK